MVEEMNTLQFDRSNLEEINRDSRSQYGEKQNKRRNRFILIAIISGLVLFAAITLLTTYLFFRIEVINIEGNTSYSDETLLEIMGVKKGSSIFLANQNKYAKRLAGKCPMVYSVRVDKNYPNEITIVITEEVPSYYISFQNVYSIISKSGKVLYNHTELEGFEGSDRLFYVDPPPVQEAVVGYGIKYRDDKDMKAVAEVIEAVEKSVINEKITKIEMASRFDIKLMYTDRFVILLGSRADISVKLKFADKIIEELKESDKGQINVKSAKKGYAILD